MITFLPFDSERDCSEHEVVQDVRVSYHGGTVAIEQPDGAGEHYHFVVLPAHMVSGFTEALHAVIQGAAPITLSGLPPAADEE